MRRMVFILPALLLSLLAWLLISPSSASAFPPLRGLPAPAQQGVCNPLGMAYCANWNYYTEARAAVNWSDTHPYSWQRWPVPYPSSSSWNSLRYYHVIYVIKYSTPGEGTHVWKYGITRQVPWTNRARYGRYDCQAWFGPWSRTRCSQDWVAVSNYQHGWYWARYVEASMVKKYQRAHHVCPPGQRISCR